MVAVGKDDMFERVSKRPVEGSKDDQDGKERIVTHFDRCSDRCRKWRTRDRKAHYAPQQLSRILSTSMPCALTCLPACSVEGSDVVAARLAQRREIFPRILPWAVVWGETTSAVCRMGGCQACMQVYTNDGSVGSQPPEVPTNRASAYFSMQHIEAKDPPLCRLLVFSLRSANLQTQLASY
jgi:hypothetical protein